MATTTDPFPKRVTRADEQEPSPAPTNLREARGGGGGGRFGGGGGGGGGEPPRPGPASFLPDPGHLWLIFRRRLWTFLAIAAVVLALVGAFTATRPELYSSTASILIEPRQPEVVESDPVAPNLAADTNVIDTEVEILSSRRLAGRVAESLDLANHPDFGAGRELDYDPDSPGTHPLAGAVLRRVDIRRAGLTYLVEITGEAKDPELAAAIPNEFARQYLAQQQEAKSTVNDEAQDFLQTRLVELRSNAAEADAALQAYKIRNGLMSAEGATMAEQEVSVLNQEISAARASLAEKSGQLAAARQRVSRGGGGAEVPAALQSGTVAELRSREATLTGEIARLDERFGDRHPELIRKRSELADTRRQIQSEINRVLSSLESDVEAARSRVASLEASQRQAERSLVSNNAAQVGFLELERNAEAARAIYEAFLERSQDVASQEGLIRPNASIETLASVPGLPSSPDYVIAALFGLAGAMILGLAGVGVAEYVDARIRTRTDVEERLGLAYMGAVPTLQSTVKRPVRGEAPQDYLIDHPQSKFAESMRALKYSLGLDRREGSTSIAITSALPREGKSTIAMGLARTLAIAGEPTVLIDCDARRHAVSDALLPEGWDGLARLLDGEIGLEQALYLDERTYLQVLGSRIPPTDGRELFGKLPLSELLKLLREAGFKSIVIDTAPALGIAETRSIAAETDMALMVARWRTTSIKAVDTASDLLLASEANLKGIALSQVDIRKYASTGEQDPYSYSRKFEGYYSE
ncbi:MAG: polysaccharide biosynthesis tyrosine autokinase [Erythrobacter sp.]|nr:polysaccharide biosynthesis tyrosine autokinase [Erythrobacter sp.]